MPRKKKESEPEMEIKKPRKGMLKVFLIAGVVLMLGIAHGFYAVAQTKNQYQFYTGNDVCNGEYLSGSMKISNIGQRFMINYKALVYYGSLNIVITDPLGNAVFNRTDEKPIFRQHSILIDTEEELGSWTYTMSCNRADMEYELTVNVDEMPDIGPEFS